MAKDYLLNPDDPDTSNPRAIRYYVGHPTNSQYLMERYPTAKGYFERSVRKGSLIPEDPSQAQYGPGGGRLISVNGVPQNVPSKQLPMRFVSGHPYPVAQAAESALLSQPTVVSPTGVPQSGGFSAGSFPGSTPTGLPSLATNPLTGAPAVPAPTPSGDPLLSTQALTTQSQAALTAAQKPVTDTVNAIVAPQMPLIQRAVEEFINKQKASAQSYNMRMGRTGSSTESLLLNRDLPEQGAQALADANVKLVAAALPIAMQDKALNVEALMGQAKFGLSLRGLVSDEKFKALGLEQQERLSTMDRDLKLLLQQIDQSFKSQEMQIQRDFDANQNALGRQAAVDAMNAQMAYQQNERRKARVQAITTSLTTIAGMAVGFALAPATGGASMLLASTAAGGMAGQQAGGFCNLFMLD